MASQAGKAELPTLGGTRIKTRKRDEKVKYDPTTFCEQVILGLNATGGGLEEVSKYLDQGGDQLNYRCVCGGEGGLPAVSAQREKCHSGYTFEATISPYPDGIPSLCSTFSLRGACWLRVGSWSQLQELRCVYSPASQW